MIYKTVHCSACKRACHHARPEFTLGDKEKSLTSASFCGVHMCPCTLLNSRRLELHVLCQCLLEFLMAGFVGAVQFLCVRGFFVLSTPKVIVDNVKFCLENF